MEPKSVNPNSHAAPPEIKVLMQVTIAVMLGIIVQTKNPFDALTVRFPKVELLTMWNVQPVVSVEVTGRVIVWVVDPMNSWY